MEIDDGNNQATEEQEEFQRLDRQLEEEAIFPQENEQPTDADVPMDTTVVDTHAEPPHIPIDFGGMDAKYFRTEYMKSMALATTHIQLMTDWDPSQLKRLESICQQV